jgi:hypothetical protein
MFLLASRDKPLAYHNGNSRASSQPADLQQLCEDQQT